MALKGQCKNRIYRDALRGIEPYPDDTQEALDYRKLIDDFLTNYNSVDSPATGYNRIQRRPIPESEKDSQEID